MSLLVNAYTRGDKGEMLFLPPNDHSKTFYGGKTARSLGLRLLPLLADEDLYVEGSHLASLQDEAKLILQNINLFAEEAATENEVLSFRVQNILDAIERAQKANGGVVIW